MGDRKDGAFPAEKLKSAAATEMWPNSAQIRPLSEMRGFSKEKDNWSMQST